MDSFLIFLCVISGIFLVAVVVNKFNGVKALYIDAWRADADEKILFEDKAADFYAITKVGRAAIMSFARLGRSHAILTNKRLVIGQKVLFGGRYMITHMLYLDKAAAPAEELDKLSAGLYAKGYQVYVTPRANFSAEMDSKKPYLKMIPDDTASAINIEHCRLYSDQPLTGIIER